MYDKLKFFGIEIIPDLLLQKKKLKFLLYALCYFKKRETT